jgi:DNA-binding transcriptional LysR family regulator
MQLFEYFDSILDVRPSVDQLEVFLAVVDAGSFRAAAMRLRRTQSSISYAIGQLEGALDRSLFERTGGRPRLTREGEAVAAQARVVLGEVHRLTAPSAETGEPARRVPLAIAVDAIVPYSILVPLLHEASHRLAGFELRVRCESKYSLLELLRDGTCDVALTGSSATVPKGLTREALRTFALVPVCGTNHPLSSLAKVDDDALREHFQIVLSERSDAARRRPIENAKHGKYIRVTELSLKLDLIRSGVGWGYLPLESVEGRLVRGTLFQLPFPRPDVGTLSLLYRSNSGATAFGQLVRERLGPFKKSGRSSQI